MFRKPPQAKDKLFELDALDRQLTQWRKEGQTIVFTNGCFDILHAGHIRYLESAAQLGDRLIIGVNDDESVRRLKGETRPINRLDSRMFLLASLGCVDAVISFTEDTPFHLISRLLPDVLAKGGDYSLDAIVGADIVRSHGGKVEVLPYVEGFSTTQLEKKILDLNRSKTENT